MKTVRDGEGSPGWSPRLSQLLSSVIRVQIQCCFTSPETIRTVRDVEPRTATSTFT